MSLLVDVMTHTLDEAYAERAARKAGAAAPEQSAPATPAGRGGRAVGVILVVALGVLTGTAVSQVRERAAASVDLRADLAAEVEDRSSQSDALERDAVALRAEVTGTRDAALGADAEGLAVAERVRALELAVGTTPVTGPGIVLTVDDAPPGDPAAPQLRGGTPADGRVFDRDLQSVVNGLWAAGAEAVEINGVRLSSRAAIRSAGEAVLVDFRPLSPPYVIEAVGRPAELEVGFLDGPAGQVLQAVASFSGITWSLERSDELELSAATEPELRAAEAAEPPG